MKKNILIFGACFSIVVLPYSLIFSLDVPKSIALGMQPTGTSFPDPISLVFLGVAMFCLANLGRKRLNQKIFEIIKKMD